MAGSPNNTLHIATKRCQPFDVDVMVYSPEAGFKFELSVEKDCSPDNEPIWQVVFDLYQKNATDFDQIVHVRFRANTPQETTGVQQMATQGVTQPQSDAMIDNVFPAVKTLAGDDNPSPEKKQQVHQAISNAVTVDL